MRYIFILLFAIFSISSQAQQDPVTWELSLQKTEAENIYNLVATASILDGWVIYSKDTEDDGPIPTSFEIVENEGFALVGDYQESREPITKYSELFEVNVSKFSDEVSLIQEVKILDASTTIQAAITYMTCSGDRCLPPKEVVLQTKL